MRSWARVAGHLLYLVERMPGILLINETYQALVEHGIPPGPVIEAGPRKSHKPTLMAHGNSGTPSLDTPSSDFNGAVQIFFKPV
jgi:hypothetical protein